MWHTLSSHEAWFPSRNSSVEKGVTVVCLFSWTCRTCRFRGFQACYFARWMTSSIAIFTQKITVLSSRLHSFGDLCTDRPKLFSPLHTSVYTARINVDTNSIFRAIPFSIFHRPHVGKMAEEEEAAANLLITRAWRHRVIKWALFFFFFFFSVVLVCRFCTLDAGWFAAWWHVLCCLLIEC